MTKDRFAGPSRSPFNLSSVMKWKNTSGETIPAYGVVKLDSYDTAGDYFLAVKPDGSGDLHFVNGPVAIAVNKYGGSQLWNQSRIGLTNSTTFGATVGPVAGSWEMEEGGSGFVIFSDPVDGIAAILQIGGGSGQVCWGDLGADTGPDDVLVSMDLYASAKPTTYVEETCGEPFIHMRWTLCGESLGTSTVAVPCFYKAGAVLLLKAADCDPGTGTSDGAQQAWDGWVVVFGDRARCAVKPVDDVECCPLTQEIKITARLNMRFIGDLGDPILTPCAE